MRTVLRLLIATAIGCAATAAADDGAVLPEPTVRFLERATAQRSWSHVAGVHLRHAEQSAVTFPSEAAGAATGRPVALGNAAAALTGLLLADLAGSGRVRLADPIAHFLPDGFACADERVCALTLQQLATQTSGLPSLPANLFPADAADPWRGYDETALLEFLANYRLPEEPAARDSALGNVLLAWLLGRVDGDGYATALRDRVVTPLGLRDTAPAAGPSASVTLPQHLRTSNRDLAMLLRAMLRPGESPLRAALMLSRQPRDARSSWGLGWRVSWVRDADQEWPLVWQSGQSAGTAVFFGFRADRQQAAAFSAEGETSLAPLGLSLLGVGGQPALPPVPSALSADPADYTGLYEFAPGTALLIRATPAGLSAQSSGRLGMRLQPLGPDLFGVDGAPIRLSFQRDAQGRIDVLRWSEKGVIVPVRRLSQRAPALSRSEVPWDAQRRLDVCGDYAIDADVLARVGCGERLTLQFSGAAPRELFAYADDRLASRDGEVELIARRDAGGRVDAMTLVLLGSETVLPRLNWRGLDPAVAAALIDERRRSLQVAAEPVSPAMAAGISLSAPWTSGLPVLAPVVVAPYRRPGVGVVSPEAPRTRNPRPTPQSPSAVNVRAAPAAAPARVETLPERFERPRFAPPRSEQKTEEDPQ